MMKLEIVVACLVCAANAMDSSSGSNNEGDGKEEMPQYTSDNHDKGKRLPLPRNNSVWEERDFDDVECFMKQFQNEVSAAQMAPQTTPSPTIDKKKNVSPSVMKMKFWIDLQAKIDNGLDKKASRRMVFCPVCGLVCSDSCTLLRHVKSALDIH